MTVYQHKRNTKENHELSESYIEQTLLVRVVVDLRGFASECANYIKET